MYLKTLLVTVQLATVAVMLASVCCGEFCDGGPAGKYCFEDLTGYHDCVFDNSTGKFVDDMVRCPSNTRCTCMGLPCTTDTPCGPYKRAPVVFTGIDFTTEIDRISIDCFSAICTTTYGLIAVWQDFSNKKYRVDNSILETSRGFLYGYTIFLPNKQSSFDEYNIVPANKSCLKSTTPFYPRQFVNMSIFSFDGTENISGLTCERWIWKAGGRRKGDPIFTMLFYIAKGKPFQYRGTLPVSQTQSSEIQIFFGKYAVGTPDPGVFELPSYCEKKPVEKTSKTDFNGNFFTIAD